MLSSHVRGFVMGVLLLPASATEGVSEVVSNVLTNPGFEDESLLSGWSAYGGQSKDCTVSHNGNCSAAVWGEGPVPNDTSGIYQQFPAQAGSVWEGKVWALNNASNPMRGSNYAVARIVFYNAATQEVSTVESPERITANSPTNWSRLTAVGEAPPGTEFVRFHLVVVRSMDTNGVAFFDDAEFGLSRLTTTQFANEEWVIRTWSDGLGSNTPCVFYSTNCVWVDTNGYLHLKIKKESDNWFCGGVQSERSFGYGDYRWHVSNRVDLLDSNVIAGLFTYEPPLFSNEIDIEFTKAFTGSNTMQLHYTVQPYTNAGHTTNMSMSLTNSDTTHRFKWFPWRVGFESYYGHSEGLVDTNLLLGQWTFTNSGIPVHAGEHVLMNLHLNNGTPPIDTQHLEMVICDFKFTDACRIHQFQFTGTNVLLGITCLETNRILTIESTTNLIERFKPVTNFLCLDSTTNWSGTVSTNTQNGFYRLKME